MPFDVTETTLPGVGKKYELYLDETRCVAVLIESSGTRRVMYRDDPDEDFNEIFELTDSQARTLGLFLVGAYYQPVAGHLPEETDSGEHIEWYSITEETPLVGMQLAAASIEDTGTTLLGIEHDGAVISAPTDEYTFEVGDRLIVCATSEGHATLEARLTNPE